jgi:hypothetical protein
LSEWLYEAGIGEARAALIENGVIVEARIESDNSTLRVGAVAAVRLIEKQAGGRRGIVRCVDSKEDALIDPIPPATDIGRAFMATVVRETIAEPGAVKRAKMRATPDAIAAPGPDLHARIAATGIMVTAVAHHGPDLLDMAGWSECVEAATTGLIAFPGGMLRISLTPAMTLIDIDGDLAPLPLALAGARAAAQAIRRFDLTGSIGVDLPTVGGKADRLAIAALFDDCVPQPFERTAVNGFGFIQIVRPRLRASLCERFTVDATEAQACALVRRAQRSGLIGDTVLVAPRAIAAVLDAHPDWLPILGAQLGGPVTLRIDPALAMSASYVTR